MMRFVSAVPRRPVPVFVRSHPFLCALSLLGLCGGVAGVALGAFSGMFADVIFARVRAERFVRNPLAIAAPVVAEPFPGCSYTLAMAAVSLGSAERVVPLARAVFGQRYRADWAALCRAAGARAAMGGDLLAEALAAESLRPGSAVPLADIFPFLSAAESSWRTADLGLSPSAHLAALLSASCARCARDDAYRLLGLAPGAPLADVKRAHRRLAAAYHPDVAPAAHDRARFEQIQGAYEAIVSAL